MLFYKFANAAQKCMNDDDKKLDIFFYQLQTFNRRARFLRKGQETKRWNSNFYPEMMSHEEKRGSVYIRHQPEYHSETFNLFLMKGVASKVLYMPAFRGRLAHK